MTLKTKTKKQTWTTKKNVTNDIEDTKIEGRLHNFTNKKIACNYTLTQKTLEEKKD
jgi:hypothetical protein